MYWLCVRPNRDFIVLMYGNEDDIYGCLCGQSAYHAVLKNGSAITASLLHSFHPLILLRAKKLDIFVSIIFSISSVDVLG